VVLWSAATAAAQPFTDVTPAGSGIVLCPADLGGGAALAWQRFGETADGRDTLDLAAAGLDPATPPAALVASGGCPATAIAPSGAGLVALNLTGLSEDEGPVIVVDRAPGGDRSEWRQREPVRRRDPRAGRSVLGAARDRQSRGRGFTEPRRQPGRRGAARPVRPKRRACRQRHDSSRVRRTAATRLRHDGRRHGRARRKRRSRSGVASAGRRARARGVAVSDRLPGGDFGPPHALAAAFTRPGGNRTDKLRLATAADGRMVASWAVEVRAGDGITAGVPVAAVRRADAVWGAAVPLAGTCREQTDAFPGFDAAGHPRVAFVDSGAISGGDYGFPHDTRIRVARLDGVPATPVAPPKMTLSANRHQALRKDEVRLRVRCAHECDAKIFAVIRDTSGASAGLFPRWARLSPGRWTKVVPKHESYFDDVHALEREGRTVKVRLVVHACDSAGRIARARRTVDVRIPRSRERA
jgi:hypothetical protein